MLTEAGEAWQDFCRRMGELGAEVLDDALVESERDRAEGLRCLTRQVAFALQHAVEFRDADFPRFHRYDDDVTKWGGPNADNNYLRCAIDPAGTYRLTAHVAGCREAILSLGEGDMQLGQYGVFSEHSLRDLDIGDDGSLEVMISADEHPGNWMATDPSVRQLTIRIYVVDWIGDAIPEFHIERLDRTSASPLPLTVNRAAEALDEAASWVETSMPYWLRYVERARRPDADNTMSPPRSAKGGAADIAYGAGYWNLADDDAWLVSFDAPEADHWSIQTQTWPWFESGDLAHAQTSLNDVQAHVDADGKVRVVISHDDPGVPNWIDTERRPVGMCVYRWIWATTMPTPTGEVMPLAELRDHLPTDHPHISAEDRAAGLAERRRGIHRRFRR